MNSCIYNARNTSGKNALPLSIEMIFNWPTNGRNEGQRKELRWYASYKYKRKVGACPTILILALYTRAGIVSQCRMILSVSFARGHHCS